MNNSHQSISEGVAVELYLDAAAEEQVLKFRELIYREGVQPGQGLMDDKPHISLAVFPITDPAAVIGLSEKGSGARALTSYPRRLTRAPDHSYRIRTRRADPG